MAVELKTPDTMEVRVCREGHELSPGNLSPEGRCKACRKQVQITYRRRQRLIAELKRKEEADIAAGKIDYLYLTPEQQDASDNFSEAVEKAEDQGRLVGKLPCREAELRYSARTDSLVEHYPHTDYDERTPPNPDEADRMCRPCPVRNECLLLAYALKPSAGVWGGKTFVDGKPINH